MARTLVTTAVVVAMLIAPLGAQTSRDEPLAWRTFAASLPTGAPVALRLKDGRAFKGTIVEVGEQGLLFKPRTRIPVPAADVAYTEIDSLELRNPGLSPGTKVVIGVGTAVGGVLLLALAVLAAAYD
jgi:hypothetical protein